MITPPWRVMVIGADLNALVNSDIVSNVAPPPDTTIFADGLKSSWLRPGRAVWKYLDGGENTLDEVKNFSRLAGELGFEYQVVEGFWSRWTEAQLREAVDFSRQHKVGLLLWKHSRTSERQRKKFFTLCQQPESLEQNRFLRSRSERDHRSLPDSASEALENRLIVDFHGANNPQANRARI
jgi:alpha-glucosidase